MNNESYYISTDGKKHEIKYDDNCKFMEKNDIFLAHKKYIAIINVGCHHINIYVDHCPNLEYLILHDDVKHIVAFECPNLKELELPKNCNYLCCDLHLINKYYKEWMYLDTEIVKPLSFY